MSNILNILWFENHKNQENDSEIRFQILKIETFKKVKNKMNKILKIEIKSKIHIDFFFSKTYDRTTATLFNNLTKYKINPIISIFIITNKCTFISTILLAIQPSSRSFTLG